MDTVAAVARRSLLRLGVFTRASLSYHSQQGHGNCEIKESDILSKEQMSFISGLHPRGKIQCNNFCLAVYYTPCANLTKRGF